MAFDRCKELHERYVLYFSTYYIATEGFSAAEMTLKGHLRSWPMSPLIDHVWLPI